MIRLSDLLQSYRYSRQLGLLVYGVIGQKYTMESYPENDKLEGICPNRILLNDDWKNGIDVTVEETQLSHKAYAYYPSEYLCGDKWDSSSTVYALCSIIYKIYTGQFPYIGNVPEELLVSENGLKYIVEKRKQDLDLTCIPEALHKFLSKGLMQERKYRYQSMGDSADDYYELTEKITSEENESISDLDDVDNFSPEFPGMMPYSSIVFSLNVQKDSEGSLDDVVGLYDQKKYFLDHFISIIQNPEKAKVYNITIPNGCLLYGPPGCGKTFFASKCAAEANVNFAIVNAQDIASTLVHGTQMLVKQMFEQAARFAPIVLILDEIEAMAPNRNNPDNVKLAEDTNAFLSELNNCGSRNVFVIGTTNRPQVMDSAILRSGRFDRKIYFPLPDEHTRAEIFKAYLKNRPIEENIDYLKLSELTSDGFVSSDIRLICDEVAIKAFNEDTTITQPMIEEVVCDVGPSVSKREIRTYEEALKFMQPTEKYKSYFNQIGFR